MLFNYQTNFIKYILIFDLTIRVQIANCFLIHEANPQSWPVVMFANGETVGLAKWIIDDTCLVFHWH